MSFIFKTNALLPISYWDIRKSFITMIEDSNFIIDLVILATCHVYFFISNPVFWLYEKLCRFYQNSPRKVALFFYTDESKIIINHVQ